MLDTNQLVERYVALWNEPDVDRRRQQIVALWTPDGLHYAKSHTCHGYCALEHRVTGSYERSIAPGINLFRHAGNIDAHHNVVRFNWHMVRRQSGDIAATGFELFVLADDGRIQADYQFVEPGPR
ncbi:MAG: nuclear transport factor 2 family protein [Rhizomicrobium sp.]